MENISENEKNTSRVPEIPNTARQGFWTFSSTEQGLGDTFITALNLPLNRNYFPLQPKMVHLYVVLSDMRILFSGRHGKYLLSVIPGL